MREVVYMSFCMGFWGFEIGTGIWASTLILKDEVTVNVILSLDLVK